MSAVCSATWRIIGAGLRSPLYQITLSSTRTSFTTRVESTLIPELHSRSLCSESKSSKSCLKIPSRLVDTLHTCRRSHIARTSPKYLSSFRLPFLGHAKFSDQRNTSIVSRPNIRKLSSAEIKAIFGNSLNRKGGIKLLRTLQDQRVAGTLDGDTSASPEQISRGLVWLRKNYLVDEDGAIIARLEREEAQVERIGYDPQVGIGSGQYSHSIVEEIRKYHKEKSNQEKEKEDDGVDYIGKKKLVETSASQAVVTRKSNIPEWVMRHREAATGKDEVPPEMTNFQRLWPSTVFTVAFVGFSILFARNYDPPIREIRLFPDIPPAATTVMALIGINVIVFAAWRIIPQALKILNNHFIWTPGLPVSSSLLGSLFSHQELKHLASNMLVLWVAGTKGESLFPRPPRIKSDWIYRGIVHDEYGRGAFLAMFLSIGVLSSYFSLAISVSQKVFNTYHMGASAGICGLLAILCWTHAW